MLLCYYYNIHRAILNRNLEKYVVWFKGRSSILWAPCHCSVASVCGNTVHGPQRVNVLVAYDLTLRLQCLAKEPLCLLVAILHLVGEREPLQESWRVLILLAPHLVDGGQPPRRVPRSQSREDGGAVLLHGLLIF